MHKDSEAEWSLEDGTQAVGEGWDIFLIPASGYQIKRSPRSRFKSNAAAQAFVGNRAAHGNELARRAFAYLAWRHCVEALD